jgi:HAD superfamily hydrolase (TIGR01509 family)
VLETSDSKSAVIFDFNGVLVWDSALHEAAWNEFAFQQRGHPLTEREIELNVHGRTNHQILEYVMGRSLPYAEERQLAEEKETLYRQLCLAQGDQFRLSPGSIELIKVLREQRVPYAIATSSGWENLDFYIKVLKLDLWFDPSRIIFDDGTFPGKPSPDIYLKATAALNIAPEQCTVIEDAISGIAAARAAGIGRIIAVGPPHKHEVLCSLPGVSCVVSSLVEVVWV